MITLVGVGHIEDIGDKVKKVILRREPSAVCIELDELGYKVMGGRVNREKVLVRYRKEMVDRGCRRGLNIRRKLHIFQVKSVEDPSKIGSELTTAIRASHEIGAQTIPIDVDRFEIARKLGKEIPLAESIRLSLGCLKGIFRGRKMLDEMRECEKEGYLGKLAEKYPTLKRVLIDERDRHMAEKIKEIHRKHKNLVAVVGNLHLHGICKLLGDLNVKVVSLEELRKI